MTAKRLNILLLVTLAALLVGLVGATYGVSGMLKTKSQQLASDRAQAQQLADQQIGLIKSKSDIARYADLEKITKAIVPQDKDQAQAVREITNIASTNHISLTSITFPSSTLGATASGTPSAAGSAKPNLSQLTPVTNIPGVYNLQITIGNNGNNTVTFSQLDAFLRGLENNRRTAAVSSLSIQPQANSANRLVFTLIISTYIKPS
ncbi:MAG: hypothetical protein JWN82_685 [Candidatus Saccharibacteria bacterium]|nr:hypothetical protein [Candidatus Saccharibacteria bacterium]